MHPFHRKEVPRATGTWVNRLNPTERRGGSEHVGKAGASRVSHDVAPQDPRGMVKAALLEVQSRSVDARPVATLTQRDVARALPEELGEEQARGRDTGRSDPGVGMSGRPKPRSIRASTRKLKIAYGARAPGRRSPHSSPRPGKPATWRRGAGGSMAEPWRYATCEMPKRHWPSSESAARGVCPWSDVYRRLFNPDLYLGPTVASTAMRGHDQGDDRRRPWTGCPWRRSTDIIESVRHRAVSMDPRQPRPTSRRKEARYGRSASLRGRTSCCKK